MSTEVEFDGIYLGQVAMLWVLVCVAVRPAIYQEETIGTLVRVTHIGVMIVSADIIDI